MLNLAEIFKALGEPVRLRLFALLSASGEQCVCHLTDALDLPQSTISRHLGVLRHAGLVSRRRDGKWMYYQLAEQTPVELTALLQHLEQTDVQQDMQRLQRSRVC